MLVEKNPPANAGGARDVGSVPRSVRPDEEGNGNPLQYSCLENPTDRGAWQATIHRVVKSQTPLKWSKHSHYAFISRAQCVFSIPGRRWGVWISCIFLYSGCVVGRREGGNIGPNAPFLHLRIFRGLPGPWGLWPSQLRAHLHLLQIRKPAFSFQLAWGTIFPFQFELHI